MGAIVNGMAVHGGVIPYGGTFLVFSDYMRPAIRLSALSDYPSIWIFTHDSIGLGEDGPTHQPVEQLASLRAIPNLVVIRPADANEVLHSWKVAIERRHSPTALILSRQNLPTIDRNLYAKAANLINGAYVLKDFGGKEPEIILMASGSEVQLIIDAAKILVEKGKNVRLVSFPSWELFNNATEEYRDLTLPRTIRLRIAVEAGISQGWEKWVGDHGRIISLETFGASAPYDDLYTNFGITVSRIVDTALSLI
jgi:transketolase